MLKSFPELMILIRGMVSAMKSVVYVFSLQFLLMYVFAILCVQLGSEDEDCKRFFANIPLAIYSLFIFATFLDDLAEFMDIIRLSEGPLPYMLLPFIFIFIALSAGTVMNMLVGVLCEVVSEVADEEKDKIKIHQLETTMGYVMKELDTDKNGQMTFEEFEQIMTKPQALAALQKVEVDPEGLVDFAELFFTDDDENTRSLNESDFTAMILRLRSTETAKVSDILDVQDKTMKKMAKNFKEITRVKQGIREMKEGIESSSQDVNKMLDECKGLLGI